MSSAGKRILSLDVVRGITIVLMILVNSQSGTLSYPMLLHAKWNGCTLADLVFPSFLFIVGVSIVIALSKHLGSMNKATLYREIFKRSLILFLLGLLLNMYPRHFDLATLRVCGILQRIALCYLLCSLFYLHSTVRTQIFLFVILILGYWLVMTQIPVPGFGAAQLTSVGSWVSYWDQLLLSPAHLWAKSYDPEGLFSTIPAVATTLCGVITGYLLLNSSSKQKTFFVMIAVGTLFLILGWVWGYSFPINKSLWTSSFVLWTSGCSLILFACCFGMIDILGYQKWALPFKIFGMNALFVFIVHVLLLKTLFAFSVSLHDGTVMSLRAFTARFLFAQYAEPNASLFYGLTFLALNFLLAAVLYQRKIFIRI